ncbi:endonuclease/exonuclease/phosphatase family protein [Maribacter halichondriae]|uniref:endonuclease/exonuclease/phosphatase family protein n=1 Tax=Maribacter halichondriae TaxID=2980554 RepID=UPI0023595963|nr:endonuclease/exonuclease/phosphatase family protein [Maribacter sp. Hal144]
MVFLMLPILLSSQSIKVMTYNIKYDNVNDTVNNWNDRKEAMVELLKKHNPSIIGMQEVLFRQLEFLDESLPSYKYVGVGRDDGQQKGEFSPILYNSVKYKLLQSNTFWLSKTPNKISVGWDAALERICTYGLFEDKSSGQKFWVFNTHFDHVGVKARKKSVKLIQKKIRDINSDKLPVVVMGDLNLTPDQKPIQLLQRKMNDGLSITKTPLTGPTGTFNGFDVLDPMLRRIDYIFLDKFDVDSYIHLDERLQNGKHVSDHLPVKADLKFKIMSN